MNSITAFGSFKLSNLETKEAKSKILAFMFCVKERESISVLSNPTICGRIAAKLALIKIIRTIAGVHIHPKEIIVNTKSSGQPVAIFNIKKSHLRMDGFSISISHSKVIAMASASASMMKNENKS